MQAANNYLAGLLATVGQARTNLPALTQSAELAARAFVAGGSPYVAGRQEDFISEACGRAGGLMAIAPVPRHALVKNDVVLYAVPGKLSSDDQKLIAEWEHQGAIVVAFSSSAGLYRDRFPLDTLANIANLWAWTGEFVAACTRLGRMPVLYQSYGLPGGVDRGKKYHGKKFHDDLAIEPIRAGTLGGDYLDQLQRMLTRIQNEQMPRIQKAAGWWRAASSREALFTGHIFPRHVQDPRAPVPPHVAAVPAWDDKDLLDPSHLPECVLYVGYQFAPRKLIAQAQQLRVNLVYFDVQPNQPAEPAANILYLDPCWPLADGCVAVSGYDIPILPASGVIDAAIYWTIVSEASN